MSESIYPRFNREHTKDTTDERFDPTKELDDDAWREVDRMMDELIGKNELSMYLEVAASVRILAPDKTIGAIDKNEQEKLRAYVERNIAGEPNRFGSWLRNAKIAVPEVFEKLRHHITFDAFQDDLVERQRMLRVGDAPIAPNLDPVDLRVLFPTLPDAQIGFDAQEREFRLKRLAELRAEVERDEFPNWEMVARKAAELRILDPLNTEQLQLDAVFCRGVRKDIDSYLYGENKGRDWYHVVNLLADLKILFAKSVTVSEQGLITKSTSL